MSFYVTVTPTIQNVEVEVNPQTLPFEVEVVVNGDLKEYVDQAEAFADQAEASAISADNSADSALASATSATASANSASSSASSASSSASTATTQAGIATTKANEASQSATNALASEQASAISEANALQSEQNALASEQSALASANTATSQAGIATTQAGNASTSASNALTSENNASASASTATTQAGIATTQASNALASANAAAASAASAAQVGTSTLLTGFSVGSNTAIAGTDSILQAFNKTQGQINARVSSNIYSANGTLAGARTLTLGGFSLDFIGTVTSRFFANGNIGIGTTTDAGFRLDVNGTTRLNGLQTFQGTTASDTAPLGSELATTGSGTNWTGTGFATGYTHTVGSTASLTTSIPAVSGTYYQIAYTITGRTAGSITINYGGTSTASITATGATGPLATSTANLEIVPTTDFDGSVVLSVRSIGTSSATTTINDSGGNARNEIRTTTGSNTVIGRNAGRRITTGTQNSIYGLQAGINTTTGSNNSFFGLNAGLNNSTGGSNSFFGVSTGSANTTGITNSFFGTQAGIANTTGSSNSFFGFNSGASNLTGASNSIIGANASLNQTSGSQNVVAGNDAGRRISGGGALTVANNSVFLGFDTRANADSETNQIVIGYQAIGLGSNTTVIGNSSTTFGRWWGNLLLGTSTNSGFTLDVAGSTRIVPPANTTGLTLSGYSLTGSDSTSAVNISGTWNTTGIPTLILANVTNTASNASSNLMDLQVGGVSRFRFRTEGSFLLGNAALSPSIFPMAASSGAISTTGTNVAFVSFTSSQDATAGSFHFIGGGVPGFTQTSGTQRFINIINTFAPTSGTANYSKIRIGGTINQTGGANGVTRGLFIDSTLTSAADWRSIEWSNNTGWGLYGAGTANNYFGGSLGIGNTSLSGYNLRVDKQITGLTTSTGIASIGTIQSDVTSNARMFTSFANTQATSFTLPNLSHYQAQQGSFGLNSVVTNQFGFIAEANIIGATNNFGFRGEIPSGTGRWNLFMNGTASNYLRGNLLLNTTTDAGFLLDVNGTARFSNDVTIADTRNIILSTTTGTRIGTATNQRLALWNATPNVQPTNAITAAAFVANTSGIVNDTATFGGYTIGQIVAALQRIGALA